MKKYIKEIIILLLQLFIFYIFPLFVRPTDVMGMVFLILLYTFILSCVFSVLIDKKYKFLYPFLVAIIFIPSIFIYYNESASIHSVWYLVDSYLGILLGLIIKFIFKVIKKN